MRFTEKVLVTALLAALPGMASVCAAEFEVLDRFSVDGYSVLRGSADIPGGSFAVGGATFVVKAGNVGIGATATNHKLRVLGRVAIDSANAGDGPGTFQQLSGYKTAGNSGVGTPIFFCDHTAAGRLYVIARYDTGALASAVFDFTVAYGNGGVTLQRISALGGVSNITAAYNNSGYQIDVAVTWTTNRPTIYWAAEGLGASNWSAL